MSQIECFYTRRMKFVYKQQPIRQHGGGFFKRLFKIENRRKVREEATAEMARRRKNRVISHGHGPFPQKGGGSGFLRRNRGRMEQMFQDRMQDNWLVNRLKKGLQEVGMRPPPRKSQKDRNDELLKNRYRKMGRRTMDIPMREFTKHGKVKRTVGRRKRYYNPWSEFTDDFE